jgi:hypothetical protein
MKVKIIRGLHGKKTIENVTFPLVKPGIHPSEKGPFVLVDGSGVFGFPPRNFRIFVSTPSDVEFDDHAYAGALIEHPSVAIDTSEIEITDTEIKGRIKERFDILTEMTISAANGAVKGIIVSGAAGVGKSYEVEAALNRDSMIDQLSFNADADDQDPRRMTAKREFNPRYAFVKGHMTPPALYKKLFDYSFRGEVLAMDDCDSIWYDEVSLNLMKAALDTSKERRISWATSDWRGDNDVPKSFTYEGSLIVITNINFERTISHRGKLAPHFEAMIDRCFYLDMTIDSLREKLLRIEQVALDFGMLRKAGLDDFEAEEIVKYVFDHANDFRYLSLRKVVQLADLYKIGGNWKRKAEVTLMKSR